MDRRLRNITTPPDTQHTPQLANSPATVHLASSHQSNNTHVAASSAFTGLAMALVSTAVLSLGGEMALHLLIHSQFYRCTNISLPNQGVNHLHSNTAEHLFAALKWHSHSFLTKCFIDLLNFTKLISLLKNVM